MDLSSEDQLDLPRVRIWNLVGGDEIPDPSGEKVSKVLPINH
jgi:hypothetical protein